MSLRMLYIEKGKGNAEKCDIFHCPEAIVPYSFKNALMAGIILPNFTMYMRCPASLILLRRQW